MQKRLILTLALVLVILPALAHGWLYRLAWDYDEPAAFNVYRAQLLEPPLLLTYAPVTSRVYIDTGIAEMTGYVYTVTAVGPGGESAPSDPLSICTGLRGDADGSGAVSAADVRLLACRLAGGAVGGNRFMDLDDDFQLTAVDLALLVRRVAEGA